MPFERLALTEIKKNFRLPIRTFLDPVEGAPCFPFNLKQGMYTDDTQAVRACAQALAESGRLTTRIIAEALRGWLFECSLSQDPRYPGLTTNKAIQRFIDSGNPGSSGVLSSSCGAAIRIAPVALWLSVRNERDFRKKITNCARITHTGQAAIDGALVVARSISLALAESKPTVEQLLKECKSPRMVKALRKVQSALNNGTNATELIGDLGGQTGADEVVPMSIYHLVKNDFQFQATIESGLDVFHPSGTDMDSILSIAGAVAGILDPAGVEESKWISGLEDAELIAAEAKKLLEVALRNPTLSA